MLMNALLKPVLNRSAFAALFTLLTLSGCYVEVSHEHEAGNDTEVHFSGTLTDMSTAYLLDAALIPFALASETPYMLADPDAYTTPRVRSANRAVITETSYAYLLDDWDCDYGGYNKTEAEAATVSYSDGYTWVDFWMNARAYNCETYQRGGYSTVNSDLDFAVTGWYDDWLQEISELDARLSGWVGIVYADSVIEHHNLSLTASALSADDISMAGSSQLWLEQGLARHSATLTTARNIHWFVGDDFPHQGRLRIQSGYDWVEFEFENGGLWRSDSQGGSQYRSWLELTRR